eukprot:3719850-Prymnesium_polylepis.2
MRSSSFRMRSIVLSPWAAPQPVQQSSRAATGSPHCSHPRGPRRCWRRDSGCEDSRGRFRLFVVGGATAGACMKGSMLGAARCAKARSSKLTTLRHASAVCTALAITDSMFGRPMSCCWLIVEYVCIITALAMIASMDARRSMASNSVCPISVIGSSKLLTIAGSTKQEACLPAQQKHSLPRCSQTAAHYINPRGDGAACSQNAGVRESRGCWLGPGHGCPLCVASRIGGKWDRWAVLLMGKSQSQWVGGLVGRRRRRRI